MKKHSLLKFALTTVSALILAVASVAASAPCAVVYYQPKTPMDMTARLRHNRSRQNPHRDISV